MLVLRYIVVIFLALAATLLGLQASGHGEWERATLLWMVAYVCLWISLSGAPWPLVAKICVISAGVFALSCMTLDLWPYAYLSWGTGNLVLYWYAGRVGFNAHLQQ